MTKTPEQKDVSDIALRLMCLSIAWMLMSASFCLPVAILIWIFK